VESIAWCLRQGLGLIDALDAKRAGEPS
jgi:hypothetical protein